MATVSKGSNAPEGDLTITPSEGEQFTVGDGNSFTTDDAVLIAAIQGEVNLGILKVEDTSTAAEDKALVESRRESEKQAKARAREITRGVSGPDLTVPEPPAETPTTDVDDQGGNS